MPVQSLIDVGFDYKRTEADKERVLGYLREVQIAITNINGMQVNGGGLGGLIKNEESLTRVQEQLNKVTADYVNLQAQVNKQAATSTATTQKQLDAFQQLVKAQKEAAAAAKAAAETYGLQSEQFKTAAANAKALEERIIAINAATKAGGASPTPVVSTTNLGNTDEARQAALATGTAVSDLEQQEAAAAIAAQDWAAAQQAAGTATATTTTVIEEELTVMQQLAETYVVAQKELNANALALKETATAYKENQISEAEYVATTRDLVAEQAILKQNLAGARIELTNQAKTALDAKGAYALLNEQWLIAKKNALDLGAALGKESVEAKAAAAEARALSLQLKELDASVGVNTREVGSYESAIGRSLGRLTSFDNVVARLITNFGRTAIHFLAFGVVFKGLELAIDAITAAFEKYKAKVTEIEESGKTLQAAIGGTEYKKAVEDVERLTIDIDLAKKGFIDKSTVVKEYNETIGKTTGLVNNIDEAEAKLIAGKEAYVQMMLYKAAATLELQKAADSLAKAEEDRNKKNSEFSNPLLDVNGAGAFGGSGLTAETVKKQDEYINAVQQKRKNDAVKVQKDASDQSLKIAKDFETKAAEIAKDHKFNLLGDDGSNGAAITNLKSFLKDLLKAQQEGEDILLQDEIKYRQAIADSDSFSYEERQRQAKKASELRIKLIKENERSELQQVLAARAEALQGYSDAETKAGANTKLTGDQRNKVLSDAAHERNIAEAAFEQQRLNIISKADIAIKNEQIGTAAELGKLRMQEQAKELADLAKGYADVHKDDYKQSLEFQSKNRSDLINSLVDNEQKAYEKTQTLRSTNYIKQKSALEAQYNDGTISYQKYQNGLRDVELKNQKASLQDQLDSLTNQYSVYQKYGTIGSEAALKIKKSIEETSAAIVHLGEKLPKLGSNASDSLKEVQNVIEKIAAGIETVADLINQAVTNSAEKQKQAIEAVEKRQQAQYEKEVQNIDNSTLSAEQKAARLVVLEAERNAQAEQNTRKEQEAELKAARVQKALTIAKIIAETALAVVHQLGSGDPYTAVGRAVAAGVIGAAQLAIAISAPLPTYKDGLKGNKPAHFGIYGEAGMELIEKPGMAPFVADKATLDYLPAHTKITPIKPSDINDSMNRSMYTATAKLLAKEEQKSKTIDSTKLLMAQNTHNTKQIVKAIGKNKPTQLDYKKMADALAHAKWVESVTQWNGRR